MNEKIKFECKSDELEQIPKEIIDSTELQFPKAHVDMDSMVNLSEKLKEYRKDTVCRIPFCVTVESEAMGAKINLGNEKNGPRVSEYMFDTIEELGNIKEIDLNKGRIRTVLDSVEQLRNQNEIVSLNVEGPFTIISSLIDQRSFYKGIRKNKEIIDNCIKVVEDSIVKYILEGIKRGANIISYADPCGSIDIVGPKIYKEISGKSTYKILKRVEDRLEDSIIHICGKTSIGLQKLDFIEACSMNHNENCTYGDAICGLLKDKEINIIGHNCIKKTNLKTKNPKVWIIKLIK
ncbi:uroporphyrinogen decarboxylase family protein [Tepidibacter hydrothermalis]|uniref:Uroporphyrinogen decarboxylase family protein n=1 Tax=Tepidibacter hydrothermalis TaxID=3036126 RepID=A0ABY8EDU3_9FIRM|nr:uroporphyrinogen decarboxylase family protein [Tepidibacter hydrothermalis]WFD11111.1 uroporphyrinogen decarboxylase family protein [Tepidibacter hydrothermalis]